MASFYELLYIEDDGLYVVGRLFELAISLEHACLVVEYGGDEGPFDGFSAAGRIL